MPTIIASNVRETFAMGLATESIKKKGVKDTSFY